MHTELELTAREIKRLKELLDIIPADTPVKIRREVTSEFGYSVFVTYLCRLETTIDITGTDNF